VLYKKRTDKTRRYLMIKKAVYAGSFDPLTLGHLDLIERGCEIFDDLILAVGADTTKTPLFTVDERVEMIKEVVGGIANVEVTSFHGLLINFVREQGARVLVRGLRAYSDFEYEFQLALTNRKMAPEVETLFMMPKEIHSYVSSSTVREVARLGGDTAQFVPGPIQIALARKFGTKR